jgi:hypothetical protein
MANARGPKWWHALVLFLAVPAEAAEACSAGPVAAAAVNAAGVDWARVVMFGPPETGWRLYAPLIAQEARTQCGPGTPGFAAAVARLDPASRGVVDAGFLARLKVRWQGRRPFVRMMARGCPPPPPPERLVAARPTETLGGKAVQLRPGALAAYRRMVEAARRESPAIRTERQALRIFSGFRDPDSDAARCLRDGNCDGTRRARCSPHRTGLAMDLWVGQAPGYGPDSTATPSRRMLVETPTYRWLVANAARFGFVPYAFEPWHWEWTGEPV